MERAVERGRAIFDNIWKFVAYLLSANVAEVAIVFIASLYGYLILPAVQLLWINLLTDGLPALALGADPESGDVMGSRRGARSRDHRAADAQSDWRHGRRRRSSCSRSCSTRSRGRVHHAVRDDDGVHGLRLPPEIVGLYVIRWLRETPMLSNPWLTIAVAVSIVLQLAVLYTPLNRYFGTVPLEPADWGLIGVVLAVCLPAYVAVATLIRRIER